MLKSLTISLGFALVAHSPILSSLLLPVVGAVVAVEAAYVLKSLRRTRKVAR
jgi:hypothetical protein